MACLDDPGPERPVREMQDPLTSMPSDGRGDLEQAVAHAFGFPPPSGLVGVAKQPHPGDDLAGQGHDLAPDPILRERCQRQVPQAHVLRDPDPVLAASTPTMAHFEVRELALGGVGRERGEPVAVDVIEPQLRPGVRALAADDDAHPVRPVLVEIEQPGHFRDVRAFPDIAVGVAGRLPHALQDQAEQLRCVLGRVNPTEYETLRFTSSCSVFFVPPAPSIRTSTFFPGRGPIPSWASASAITLL